MTSGMHWVGTWATAPAPAEGVGLQQPDPADEPARQHRRRHAAGAAVERLWQRPLAIGAAHIGLRATGPGIVPGSERTLTFGGAASATIAAGALLMSDPVELDVAPLADLAVSFYLPGDVPASFGITGRYARQTNYISPPGDFSAAAVMPVGRITDEWYFRQRHRRAGAGARPAASSRSATR